MRTPHERKANALARRLLEEGEQLVAVLAARPLRWPRGTAGSVELGAVQRTRAHDDASDAGLPLADRMALVLTERRLLAVKVGTPIGLLAGARATELLGAVPLTHVDAIGGERLGLGRLVTMTVGGRRIKLEARPLAGVRALRQAFEQAKPRGFEHAARRADPACSPVPAGTS